MLRPSSSAFARGPDPPTPQRWQQRFERFRRSGLTISDFCDPAGITPARSTPGDSACSTGSACSSGSLLPSPVLQAMGLADDILRSAMRFSFAAGLSIDDVNEAARRIIICVNDLRRKNI